MPYIYLIHGWSGNSNNAWFPWLKEKLLENNFKVTVPEMPDADSPKIETWIEKIKEVCPSPNENTLFIGHSIGCQAIMRFVEKLGKPIGKIILVAPFFNLNHLQTEEEKVIAKPWLESPIDFKKIKNNTKEIVAIFSDNDPDVDLSEKDLFEKNLNAKIVIEHNKGHFSDDAGIIELPSVLKFILKINK